MTSLVKPLVSVKTITYNHAPYIRRCIESILMQKTTFLFELVIGEDCSTDGTREIVLDYAQKYPGIIRVITSDVNVGAIENSKRTNLACQGEFIAFCEGDDYWIDPLKLQKQYEAINKYDAVLVAHGSFFLYLKGDELISSKVVRPRDEAGILNIEDIILNNIKFHTSSIFVLTKIIRELPDWSYRTLTGVDVPLKLYAASVGKVFYIDEIMSVYQNGASGSWTFRQKGKMASDENYRIDFEKSYIEMYKIFDEFTQSRFSRAIHQRIHNRLENYYNNYGNLDCLNIGDDEKKTIRIIAYLSRLAPAGLRNAIVRSQVDKYLPFI